MSLITRAASSGPLRRNRFGRDARDRGSGGDVLGDDRSGGRNGARADRNPREDGDVGAQPRPVADDDGRGVHVGAFLETRTVIEGRDDGVVANEHVVTNGDAALVLEGAPGIDECALPERRVLPEVRAERREQHERFGYLRPAELAHEATQFDRVVVAAVDFRGNAECSLAGLVHDPVQRRAALDRLARAQRREQILHRGRVTAAVHVALPHAGVWV